jgi:hypothetical protein
MLVLTEETAGMKKARHRILGRIPLPRKAGGPQTTRKGKKGYTRMREKQRLRKAVIAKNI